jgi:hypothetical protein
MLRLALLLTGCIACLLHAESPDQCKRRMSCQWWDAMCHDQCNRNPDSFGRTAQDLCKQRNQCGALEVICHGACNADPNWTRPEWAKKWIPDIPTVDKIAECKKRNQCGAFEAICHSACTVDPNFQRPEWAKKWLPDIPNLNTTQTGETKIRIANNTTESFKIRALDTYLLCQGFGVGGCGNPIMTNNHIFLGLFLPSKDTITFDWIPRSIKWERSTYSIYPQRSKGQIDLIVESGAEWSSVMAKCGGSWGNLTSQNRNDVTGTDLWIKAGSKGLIIDNPERATMQVGPHLTCKIECQFAAPIIYPNYALTFAEQGDPEVWLRRSFVPNETNVVLQNSIPVNWTVVAEGFSEPGITIDNKKSFELAANDLEKVYSFGPAVPRNNVINRDGSVNFTFIPNQPSVAINGVTVNLEPFMLSLSKVKTDVKPQVKVGKSRYRLARGLLAGRVVLDFTQSPEQWRFNLSLDQTIIKKNLGMALKDDLRDAIKENRAGRLSIDKLKTKINEILGRRAEEELKKSAVNMTLDDFKKEIINAVDPERTEGYVGMVPVFWFSNNIDMIDFFAKKGADLTIQNNRLLWWATVSNAGPAITRLFQYNLVPDLDMIKTAYHANSLDVAKQLFAELVDRMIREKNTNYLTVVTTAISDATKEAATGFATWARRELYEKGKKANRNDLVNTAVDLAGSSCLCEIPSSLLKPGQSPSPKWIPLKENCGKTCAEDEVQKGWTGGMR